MFETGCLKSIVLVPLSISVIKFSGRNNTWERVSFCSQVRVQFKAEKSMQQEPEAAVTSQAQKRSREQNMGTRRCLLHWDGVPPAIRGSLSTILAATLTVSIIQHGTSPCLLGIDCWKPRKGNSGRSLEELETLAWHYSQWIMLIMCVNSLKENSVSHPLFKNQSSFAW